MNYSKIITLLLSVLVAIAIVVVFYFLRGILKPFLVAIFLTILLGPLVDLLQKIHVPKGLAVTLVLLLTFAFLFLLGLVVYASVTSFSDELPKYEAKFVAIFHHLLDYFNVPLESVNTYLKNFDWMSALKELSLPGYITSTVGSFFQFLANVFLVLLFMVYALLGKESLFVRIRHAFRGEQAEQVARTVETIDRQIQEYLIAKTLISVVTGLLATGVLLIFGVDFAIVWGLLTFLLNYIPNIGSTIATLPPILLALLQFDSFWRPLWITVLLILIQMTMGNVVEPRFMGKRLDLSPLVVILSLIFWGFLWGIVGMILAVPIAATVKIVTENIEPLKPISFFLSGGVA